MAVQDGAVQHRLSRPNARPPTLGSSRIAGDSGRDSSYYYQVASLPLLPPRSYLPALTSQPRYGRLLTVELHLTQSGTAQFAILGFASEADATAAVEELDGYRGLWISGGRPLKVDFAQLPKSGGGGKGKAGALVTMAACGGTLSWFGTCVQVHACVGAFGCERRWVGGWVRDGEGCWVLGWPPMAHRVDGSNLLASGFGQGSQPAAHQLHAGTELPCKAARSWWLEQLLLGQQTWRWV